MLRRSLQLSSSGGVGGFHQSLVLLRKKHPPSSKHLYRGGNRPGRTSVYYDLPTRIARLEGHSKHDVYRNLPQIRRNDVRWYLLDATGMTVDRVVELILPIISGKTRPDGAGLRPGVIVGDNVIVINAKEVVLPHERWTRQMFAWDTRRVQGFRLTNLATMRARKGPEFVIFQQLYTNLPKAGMFTPRTRSSMRTKDPFAYQDLLIEKVFIFPDEHHPFTDQLVLPLAPPLPPPLPRFNPDFYYPKHHDAPDSDRVTAATEAADVELQLRRKCLPGEFSLGKEELQSLAAQFKDVYPPAAAAAAATSKK